MGSMYPHITVYNAEKDVSGHADVSLHASKAVRILYGFLRGVGLGGILLVVAFLIFTFEPAVREEFKYIFDKDKINKESHLMLEQLSEADRAIAIQNEAKYNGVDPHFSVVIPKIDAKSNIVANVDPFSKGEYKDALMEGIAHAKGTYFPGQGKNIFLFSHSVYFDSDVARYNAVFYLLRKLEVGDRVIVYFSDERFVYEVVEMLTVPATDIHYLTDQTDSEVLYLQTCDPPGTTWKRLIVKAEPIV